MLQCEKQECRRKKVLSLLGYKGTGGEGVTKALRMLSRFKPVISHERKCTRPRINHSAKSYKMKRRRGRAASL